ncbi:MAG: hypothetical protein CMK78_08440 [Pseudomonadales bacterium]|jgi:hypothetical protein|nr:hypothetical protein [Pseudomonadales bacterium]|tara:strand:- start:105 stop:350 length:246 start_codon:yes stop_codon:yes gene_type:complete
MVVPCPGLITKRVTGNTYKLAGAPFTDSVLLDQVPGDYLSTCRRYHFLESTPFIAATSSRLPAQRFFSLLFSDFTFCNRMA